MVGDHNDTVLLVDRISAELFLSVIHFPFCRIDHRIFVLISARMRMLSVSAGTAFERLR